MNKFFILFIILIGSMFNVHSQNKNIKGKVISEYIETIPYVSIMVNDTVEIGTTDENGFFQIDIPVDEKKILFSLVGMEPTTIELLDNCDRVEVVMMYDTTYDFITLKQVERKREKRFKKLDKIHGQAFKNGIFETEHACYNREFDQYLSDKE